MVTGDFGLAQNNWSPGVLLVGSNALLVAFTSVCEKYVVRNVDQAALGFSLYRALQCKMIKMLDQLQLGLRHQRY